MWYKKNKRIISLFMAMVMLMGVLVSNVQPSYIHAEGSSAAQQQSTEQQSSNTEEKTEDETEEEAQATQEDALLNQSAPQNMSGIQNALPVQQGDNNITPYVNVKLDKMYIADKNENIVNNQYIVLNGNKVEPQPKVGRNDGIKAEYKWDVPREHMPKVKRGSYFTIELPDQNVLKAQIGTYPIICDNEKIGEFYIDNGFLTATFTKDLNDADRLKNGYFTLFSMVIAKEGTVEIIENHTDKSSFTLDITKEEGGGGNHQYNPDKFKKDFPWDFNIGKDAWQDKWTKIENEVGFSIHINAKEMSNLYSTPNKKQNVVVIDEMPEGLANVRKMEIMVPIYAPKLNKYGSIEHGKTSSLELFVPRVYHMKYDEVLGSTKFWTHMKTSREKSWEDFQAEVRDMGKTNPTVGIWQNIDKAPAEKGDKMIIAFGDLPNPAITYGDALPNFDAEVDKLITNGGRRTINHEIADVVKTLKDKPVVAFTVVLVVPVDDVNKTSFKNEAIMNWDTSRYEKSQASVNIKNAQGGVDYENDTVTISVEKIWRGPKKDKVILQLKDGDNVLQEIELNESTNWRGIFNPVRKYRNHSIIQYKVVEKNVPSGYGVNVSGDAESGHFKVTNFLSETRIKVVKKWKDSQGDIQAPVDEITLKLFRKSVNVAKEYFKDVVLTKDKGWQETVVVPTNDPHFDKYEYSFEEAVIDGYDSKIKRISEVWNKALASHEYEWEYEYEVTNTEDPKNINLEIDKKWVAFDGKTPITPPDNTVVSLKIYKIVAGQKTYLETARLDKSNNWHFVKTGLKKFEKGKAVSYNVEEISVAGYSNIKNERKITPDGDHKFELTNKLNNIPKISITVEKQWEKINKNGHAEALSEKYKKKLSGVEVELLKDGVPTGTKRTLDNNNGYKAVFDNLDEINANGTKIVYSVRENNVPGGFKVKQNPATVNNNKAVIVNQKEEKVVKISVEKNWQDQNGNIKTEGLPESINLQVIGKTSNNSVVVNRQLTIYKNKNWKGSLDNLPAETDDGENITYSLQENTVPGYLNGDIRLQQDSIGNYNFTVINKEVPKTEIKVEKKWQNENGGALPNDHKRLKAVQSITVELLKDGAGTGLTKSLTKANNWKESFTGLDKTKADGTAIVYSVRETTVPEGFAPVANPVNAVGGSVTLINKLKPNFVNITVKKVWAGSDSNKPEVTLKLVQQLNGGSFTDVPGKSIKLPHNNSWNYTFNGLPAEDSLGNPIRYEVREDNVPAGYSRAYDHSSYTVINTKIEKISINVEKKWLTDNGNKELPKNYRLIPDQIEVELLANDAPMSPAKIIVLKKSENWKGRFEGLDKTDNQGNPIRYTVKERAKQPNFNLADIAVPDNTGNAVIKNIQTKENTVVKIKKVWQDKDGRNVTGDTSNRVKLEIYYDDNGVEKIVNNGIVLPTSDGRWEYTESGLTKFDQEGKLIQYKVREIEVPEGYARSVADDNNFNFTVTNKEIPKTNIEVEKKWVDDKGDKLPGDYKLIPDSLEIRLLANDVPIQYKGQDTVKILKSNNWKYEFTDLYELDVDGKPIKYSVQEILSADVAVNFVADNLTVGVTGGKATLVNKKTDERVSVAVKKIWKDLSNNDITQNLPAEIELKLIRTINGRDELVQPIKLPYNGKWETTITGLAKYDSRGLRIVYKIVEEKVPNGYYVEYGSPVVGTNDTSLIVTNRQMPKVEINVEKKWVDKNNTPLANDYATIPDSIRVKLLANGNETGRIIEVLKANNWKGKFDNLDEKDSLGRKINYTVEEIMSAELNKSFVVSENKIDNYSAVITNKDTDQKVKVKINKVWTDENGNRIDAQIPDDVQLIFEILKYDGKDAQGYDIYSPVKQSIKVSKATGWSYESDLLPKLDAKGKEIVYYVREVEVPAGYRVESEHKIDAANNTFTFKITNQRIPKTGIDIEKKWIDKDNNPLASTYQRIPEKITVRLLANGHEKQTLDVLKKDNWKGAFTDLPITDMYHNPITYKVEEINVPNGFTVDSTKAENGKVVITNKKLDETVKVSVRKLWLNVNNAPITNANVLPQFVRMQLLADGVSKGTFYVYKDRGFAYESENLAKYDVNGREIVYTIKELDVTYGYRLVSINKSTNGLEFTVTNMEIPTTPPHVPYIPPYIPNIPEDPVPTPPARPTPPPPNTPDEEIEIEDDDVALSDGDDEEIKDEVPVTDENLPKTHDLLNTFTNTLAVVAVSAIGLGMKEISSRRKKDDDEK